ncbi:hypothetical protein CASFOL_038546 [Castilleja foliolosa]|uniref:Uncharacterized protein n=1 Tax=Castilleja foliolosa TaxID=1961234 RepID=A0ABD3BL92_9LAMI
MAERKSTESSASQSDKHVKSPNVIEQAKEGTESSIPGDKSPRHQEETHGTSDDIDSSTSVEEVKGPGVLQRVKEEIEAVVDAVTPKK